MTSLRVGLTGPMGAGKSTVAACWKRLGAGLVDGDEMGRLAIATDAGLRQALILRFGKHIATLEGEIVRSELAREAFRTPANQRDLTELTFPTLYTLAMQAMEELSTTHQIVVFDAALIFEWEIETDFDRIAVVTAPELILVANASKRLGLSTEEAAERLSRQISASEKVAQADYVIVNSGSVEELITEAGETWKLLEAISSSDD